jgi:eukaryotic-like serine/threonine-protein kinase
MPITGEAPGDPTYNIVGVITGGGQGLVIKADHIGFGRPCIQKTVRVPNISNSLASRFREARIMDALRDDETVATVIETQPDPQYPGAVCIVMDFYAEGSVYDALASGRHFSLSEAVSVGCDVLTALGRLHGELGYVHSDVKPGNVLLWSVGSRGALTDFGGSHQMMSGVAPITTWTWPYLAPEVATSGMSEVTPASDIYAAGMTLFEMLCGPFAPSLFGAPAEARVRRGLRGVPDQYLGIEAHVPRELRTLIGRAINRDPARRPRSCAELKAALRVMRFIDWRRLSGVGPEGRWEGSWPTMVPLTSRRNFRVDVTRTRAGLRASASQQLTPTGPWRRLPVFPDQGLDPVDPARSLTQFFRTLSDEVLRRFPS